MRIISIVGARPQFIKLAPLWEATKRYNVEHIVINSGQHYDYELAAAFFEEYKLSEPQYNLSVGSGTHAYQIGTTMMKTEKVLSDIEVNNEDVVVVYGDTNTTLGAAIASAKMKATVAHIEAGIREGDTKDVPEETNRILTDHISDILFPPTKSAKESLLREGFSDSQIPIVGDVMVDALEITKKNMPKEMPVGVNEKYILLTLHRPRNVDDKNTLKRIISALGAIEYKIVLPIHPRTEKRLKEFNLELPQNIIRIPPQNHRNFVKLISESEYVITDSGGTPKEAFLLKKKSIILRHVTGWVELLENNATTLVDPRSNKFIEKFEHATSTIKEWETKWKPNPFGEPGVTESILKVLIDG